jgi:peptidoglycan/xylan/chitin deacetylase (PgdA/CDA1 family)
MTRFLQRLDDTQLAIFLFHGVVERSDYNIRNYTRKHLEKDEFAHLITALKVQGTPLSMNEVIELHDAGEPFPARSFAITFDDGFQNNLTIAAPVLADLGVPATFYVTTDFIERNRQSWIDRIEWAVEPLAVGQVEVPWRELPLAFSSREEKRVLLHDIRANVKTRPELDPDAFATAIQKQLGSPETWSSNDPLDAKMTWNEVAELNSHSEFEVAGHSHTHAILSHLAHDAVAEELDFSLSLLESKAGIVSMHYSYPEGLEHCFSESVIEALKARGIRCCPTAIDGSNPPGTDLFHLKRIMVD